MKLKTILRENGISAYPAQIFNRSGQAAGDPVKPASAKTHKPFYHFAILSFAIDLFLLAGAFLATYYYKNGSLVLDARHLNLLSILGVVWLVVSLLLHKFDLKRFPDYGSSIKFLSSGVLSVLYVSAILLVMTNTLAISRLQFFGTFALYFLFTWSAFSLFYVTSGRRFIIRMNGKIQNFKKPARFSSLRLSIDFILLALSGILMNYYEHRHWQIDPQTENLFVGLVGLWLISGVITRKFEKKTFKNIYYAITPFIKSYLLMAALMAVGMLALHISEISRLVIFGSLTLFVVMEISLISISRILREPAEGDLESFKDVREALDSENSGAEALKEEVRQRLSVKPVADVLRRQYLREDAELYSFISEYIDLNTIDEYETKVLDTRTRYNIKVFDDHSQSLIINLHKINDFRWLNRYFLEVHRKIYNGGYFVGQAHTIVTHKNWMFEKFPTFIANLLYPLDFMLRRVFPKLPLVKKIYFTLTRGHNRLISKAETLGRLYFCGFKVIAVREINNRLYYIAQRTKQPSLDQNPTYGPIIRLRRIGLDGNIIRVRKFRTMHPYSEYLQQYIYENNNLQTNGKFKDDFRITEWGRWFRRLWIDELPQLMNYLEGEVSLVGVRALSRHYFDLYPPELQELRTHFKPGLVPPYYADMPESFEDIVESERRYLQAKQKAPFSTDLRYFFKAFINIFFKNARSR